jgi:hypothetical protein
VADALLIDASVIIDHLRGEANATGFLVPLLARGIARLHPAVVAEVIEGARDARHLRSLDAALAAIPVVRA